MAKPIINFIKKTYKVLIVILAAIIFFLGYNVYLVDRSLTNLRFALTKIDDVKSMEDAKKLSTVLDFSLLMEVASKELPSASIARLELAKEILSKPQELTQIEKDAKKMGSALYYSLIKEVTDEELQETSIPMMELAKDILTGPKELSQLKDAKFALSEVIKQKESKRAPILVALDRINQILFPAVTTVPKAKLEKQASYLKKRLKNLKDKNEIQETYYELGNIYTQLSEFTKAEEAYRKVIDLNPESILAKKSHFNLAWSKKIKGNFDEAIKEFEVISQAYAQEEIGTFSQYQIADTLRKKGDYEKAIVIYQQLSSGGVKTDLAQLTKFMAGYTYLYDLKNYDISKDILDKAKEEFKGYDIASHIENVVIPSLIAQYYKEGFRLLREGYESSLPQKYKEAQKYFDKALATAPEDGISNIGKALALLWLGDPDRALGYARRAVKFLPSEEVASVNLGYIYIQLNLIDEAVIEFKRYISVNPFTSRGYYNLGYAYALQNRLEEAALAFQKATLIEPKFALALNNRGWCLWQLKRYSEAIDAFQKAIQIKPDFLDALFNLGVVYRILGRYEEAKKNFQSVLGINPIYPEAQIYLKDIENIIHKESKSK